VAEGRQAGEVSLASASLCFRPKLAPALVGVNERERGAHWLEVARYYFKGYRLMLAGFVPDQLEHCTARQEHQ